LKVEYLQVCFSHLVQERLLSPASRRVYLHGIRFLYLQVLRYSGRCPCGRFPGSFQVVEGKAVLSILLAVSNVILGWQWHGHADRCSKRSYGAGS
jgi:hypothetical protein